MKASNPAFLPPRIEVERSTGLETAFACDYQNTLTQEELMIIVFTQALIQSEGMTGTESNAQRTEIVKRAERVATKVLNRHGE